MRRPHFALGLIFLTLTFGTLGRADSELPLDLKWTVPTGCPDRAYVIGEVRTLLGAATPSHPPIRADGEISLRPGGRMQLTLVTWDADGSPTTRQIESTSCKALADAASVFLALAIDPGGSPAAPPGASTSASVSPPSTATASASASGSIKAPPARSMSPQQARDRRVAAWAAPAIVAGSSPGLALGVAIGVGANLGPAWVGLAGYVSPLRSYAITGSRAGNLSVSSIAAQPHAAVRLGAERWLEVSAGIDVASVYANFDSIANSTPSRMLRVSPTLSVGAAWPLFDGLYVRAFLGGMVPVVRPKYTVVIDGREIELFRSATILGIVGAGIEVRL